MRQPPTNICPLLAISNIGSSSGSAVCLYDRCAWWDNDGCECALVTGAIAIREAAENLEVLAVNSQAFGILQKNELPGATNTEQLEGGTDLTGPNSTSNIT